MAVRDIMSTDVRVVSPDVTIQQAAEQMRELDVGSLPVCDGGRLIGMVTDRDIAVRAVARGDDPKRALVRDVMSGELVWCFDDESIEELRRKMRDRAVRRIPVLNRDKALVGIVALADIATQVGDQATKSRALEGVSTPNAPPAR
jgi:CBS domain-containing protein